MYFKPSVIMIVVVVIYHTACGSGVASGLVSVATLLRAGLSQPSRPLGNVVSSSNDPVM